jgi:hypothetical protein
VGGNNRSTIAVLGKRGVHYPTTSTATGINTQAPTFVESLNPAQIIGVSSTTQKVAIPALGAALDFVDIPFGIALTLPTFTLTKSASGVLVAHIDLTGQLEKVIITLSKQISFGGVGQSNTWTLTPGTKYSGAKVIGTLRAIALEASEAQNATLVCDAAIYGVPT